MSRTASKLSNNMAPIPPFGKSFSLEMVLADVPVETRLWKPDTAPQATVTNRIGNRSPELSVWKPVFPAGKMHFFLDQTKNKGKCGNNDQGE